MEKAFGILLLGLGVLPFVTFALSFFIIENGGGFEYEDEKETSSLLLGASLVLLADY